MAELSDALAATRPRVAHAGAETVSMSEGAAHIDIRQVELCDFCSGAADATAFRWSLALPGGSLGGVAALLRDLASRREFAARVVRKLAEWGWTMAVGDLLMREAEVITTGCRAEP